MSKTNYLFLGNPGTGKSTLINCLVGEVVFQSGISYGGGLTSFFQKHEFNGNMYMDTPGLADRKLMESAAAAITEALRQSGEYKLFFMVRLENGRVVADDLSTIETVVSSIDMKDIPFTVIINNVKKRQFKAMMEKGDAFWEVVTLINAGKFETPELLFIQTQDDLDEQDDAITTLPGYVTKFIQDEAPTVVINPEDVSDISPQDFIRQLVVIRAELQQLQEDNNALRRRLEELQGKPGFFRDVGKGIDKAIASTGSFFSKPFRGLRCSNEDRG
ncbi:hypothetical protein L917_02816 [Phytophthora nicotianae]|uniref:G domain-containing protein n=1 Tax=Phytophthora nicotianae TaxID=4792 RepID=W2LSU5_PHYNI|nr:hypothetical protein L917_02816 [Phytophthora nicotianae]